MLNGVLPYSGLHVGQRLATEVPRPLASELADGEVRLLLRAVFEAYLERALVPNLSAGQVMVMDNLSAHRGARVPDSSRDEAASYDT